MTACLGPPPQQSDHRKNFFGYTPLAKFLHFHLNPFKIFEYLNFLKLAPFNLFLFVAWFWILVLFFVYLVYFSGPFGLFLFGEFIFVVDFLTIAGGVFLI